MYFNFFQFLKSLIQTQTQDNDPHMPKNTTHSNKDYSLSIQSHTLSYYSYFFILLLTWALEIDFLYWHLSVKDLTPS